MNSIADKVEVFFNELPTGLKEEISFGKPINLHLDDETERLRDSTHFLTSRERRSGGPTYNFDMLNELASKIKS